MYAHNDIFPCFRLLYVKCDNQNRMGKHHRKWYDWTILSLSCVCVCAYNSSFFCYVPLQILISLRFHFFFWANFSSAPEVCLRFVQWCGSKWKIVFKHWELKMLQIAQKTYRTSLDGRFIGYWTGNEVENVCHWLGDVFDLLKFHLKVDSPFMEIGEPSTNLLHVNRLKKRIANLSCPSSMPKKRWRTRRRRCRRQLINPEINLLSTEQSML